MDIEKTKSTRLISGEVYREYVPRVAIDPNRGFKGDIANTAVYWEDEQALMKHEGWIEDQGKEWKLNKKYLDLDRQDLHAGYFAVDKGRKFVKKASNKNPAFFTCLSEGKKGLKGVAAGYPKYDAALGKIMTIESRVEYCATTHLGRSISQGTKKNNMISMYIKSLSTGKPLQIDINATPIAEAYKRGEKLFYTRAGQFNYACASCHTPKGMMGKHLRGQVPTTVFGDAAQYPVYHTKLGLISMAQRIGQCNWVTRTARLKAGDPAYTDLEVFLSVLSNGYPIAVPSVRN